MARLADNSEHMKRFHDEHFGPAPTQEVKCPICGERFTLHIAPVDFHLESAAGKKGASQMTMRVEYLALNTHEHKEP